MGPRYLIDSNVLIDYVALRLPPKGDNFMESLFDSDFLISVAVEIEVLGFDDVPAKLKAMENFVGMATILPLDEAVKNRTILLRRAYKKLKLGDAIIAATALVHGLTIISRNTKDFQAIAGLNCLNPHELQ
jgi:predicted nucleic acid-binding protein